MEDKFYSLYDHLGRAAGPALGFVVAKYATIRKEPIQTRQVEVKTYKGTVNLYRRPFLEVFFNDNQNRAAIEADTKWYEAKIAAKRATASK